MKGGKIIFLSELAFFEGGILQNGQDKVAWIKRAASE